MDQHAMTWRHTNSGLVLTAGDRVEPVPDAVAAQLLGPETALTIDPGADLVDLERQLRGMARELAEEIKHAERRLTWARTAAAAAPGPWWSWAARRMWRSNQDELTAAMAAHDMLTGAYKTARGLQTQVRRYVMDLDLSAGLLAEAARGWHRSPDIPGSVAWTFDSEAEFLDGDARRASEWADAVIGGDVLGHGWRRDGDDDARDCLRLDRIGPWLIGYIARTGEIYAARRSRYLSEWVWLLGTDFTPVQAYALVSDMDAVKREPNSVVAAAELVADASRAARRDHATENHQGPDPAAESPVSSADPGDAPDPR